MRSFVNLFAVLVVLGAAAFGCKWNSAGTNTTPDQTPTAASTPEPESSPSGTEAQAKFVSAEPLITELYKQHDADKGPFRERKRATVDKYFAKPLADMIWKNEQRPAGEMGAIDADPLYDAQDVQIKKLSVGKAVIDGAKATVPVTFENYGLKKTLTYLMVKEGDAWKISDIKYPGGYTLVQNFREYEKSGTEDPPDVASTPGEFEGKYHVGDTTCIVRPERMAFTVKWAKGSGVEYFYYKDVNVFESEEDKSGGRNEFRFDDENYNSGSFVRADGKTFRVSRSK